MTKSWLIFLFNAYYTTKFLLIFFRFLSKGVQKVCHSVAINSTYNRCISTFSWHIDETDMAVVIRGYLKMSSAFQGLQLSIQFVAHGKQNMLWLPQSVYLTIESNSSLSLIPNHEYWYIIEKPHLHIYVVTCQYTCIRTHQPASFSFHQ